MNWYLFALVCFGLILLLMLIGAGVAMIILNDYAKYKAKITQETVEKICEKTIDRMMQAMIDCAEELMDYAMDNTKKMVEDTFKTNDES